MDGYTSSEINKGLKKLKGEINRLNSSIEMDDSFDSDALSLIVDEALKGVDIHSVYPSFYHRMIKSAELRQKFLDAVESVNNQDFGQIKDKSLIKKIISELITTEACQKQKIQLSVADLNTIFFPPQVVYRSAVEEEASDFLMMNEEIELNSAIYSLLVEGSLESTELETLSLTAFVSVVEKIVPDSSAMPLDINVTWGDFSKVIHIPAEGEFHLVNVPYMAFLNNERDNIANPLEISISRSL
jgi:hypothetical protein